MTITDDLPESDLDEDGNATIKDRSVAGAFARTKDYTEKLDVVVAALIELGDSKLGRVLNDYLDDRQQVGVVTPEDRHNAPGGPGSYDDLKATVVDPGDTEVGAQIEEQVGAQYRQGEEPEASGGGEQPKKETPAKAKPEGSSPTS